MLLGMLTLLVAIAISMVSAYYSILGLAAIFAGAFWPIIIMGSALEVGKLTTVVWLHYNWERASYKIKSYLVIATILLALITSMGVFGALSKFHLDQNIPSSDVAAQVALLDEKIATQRDNIASAKAAITQLNASVDQIMGRTTDANGATKAASLRRAQQRERAALAKDIDQAQAEIAKLQETRAPIASTLRKVEADVGPIKYLAALVYGDNPEQNTLERAVRWVIVIIVFVFDPLAIVLLLAATTSMDWSKLAALQRKKEKKDEDDAEKAQIFLDTDINQTITDFGRELEDIKIQVVKAEQEVENTNKLLLSAYEKLEEQAHLTEDISQLDDKSLMVDEALTRIKMLEEEKAKSDATIATLTQNLGNVELLEAEADQARAKIRELTDELAFSESASFNETSELTKECAQLAMQLSESTTAISDTKSELTLANTELAEVKDELSQVYSTVNAAKEAYDSERELLTGQLNSVSTELSVATEKISELTLRLEEANAKSSNIVALAPAPITDQKLSTPSNASFGTEFPTTPAKGDLFLRVDFMPSKLFKWSGERWIELDKTVTDVYTIDESYIKMLVQKLGTGEYSLDDLTPAEQTEVAAYLVKAQE